MKCAKCGIEFYSPFCPNCGSPAPQQPQPSQQQQPNQPFQQLNSRPYQQQSTYQQNQQNQLPPPIPPYQNYPHKNIPPKRKKGCLFYGLITVGALMFIGIIGSMFSSNDNSSTVNSSNIADSASGLTPTASPRVTQEPTLTPAPTLTPKQSFIKTMAPATGLREKTASKLYTLLTEKLGFSDITFVGKDEYGDIVFDVSADDYSLVITVDDESIYSILCGDYTLYDGSEIIIDKQGILDRTITDSERISYYSIAQEIIKDSLKSPKSADFPSIIWSSDEIAMQKNGDIIAVKSYVDADNSFGANIRSDFLVEFQIIDIDSYTYLPIYINIDGEESGEFIDLN